MTKTRIMFLLALSAVSLTGCRINVIRLENRLEKWESLAADTGRDPESKAEFALETLDFFTSRIDFQRSREAVVTEAERLTFNRRLSATMQVFLIDYYAGRAIDEVSGGEPDWEEGRRLWTLADSLSQGFVPGTGNTYKMVLLQKGYRKYIEDMTASGAHYIRLERDFPGLMEAFRKMSEFKCREAEYLFARGERKGAMEACLYVFIRDKENFATADMLLQVMTGESVREIYSRRFAAAIEQDAFLGRRGEIYDLVESRAARIGQEADQEEMDRRMKEIFGELAVHFNVAPQQIADLYYYSRSEFEGSLPEYINLWRPQVLEGHKPLTERVRVIY